MKKEEFLAQYQTKEWYELSKKIKSRDKNTCQMCGRNDVPLSVHHKVYYKNIKVWEYPEDTLICICDRCHEFVTESGKEMYKDFCELKQYFREFGFSDNVLKGVFRHLYSLLESVLNNEGINDPDSLAFLRSIVLSTQDYNDLKVLKRFGVNENDFVRFLYPNLLDDYTKNEALCYE